MGPVRMSRCLTGSITRGDRDYATRAWDGRHRLLDADSAAATDLRPAGYWSDRYSGAMTWGGTFAWR